MADLFHPNRIARKLIKALIVFSTVLTIGVTALQLWAEYGRDISAIDARFAQVERGYLDSVAETVWQADDAGIKLLLKGITEFPDFEMARVRAENGEVLQSVGMAHGDSVRARTYPLTYTFRGKVHEIGTLEVSATLSGVYERMWDRVGLILLSNAVKTALVAGFLFALVYWLLTRHLDTMARYARALTFDREADTLELERGQYAGGRDELDDLCSALNEMKSKLFESYAELRQLSDELEVRVRGRTRALSEEAAMRKRIAEQLAKSESRLRDMAEAGSDWMWEMSAERQFTFISGGPLMPVIFPGGGAEGRFLRDLPGLDARSEAWAGHEKILEAREPFRDLELRLETADGRPIYVRVSGKPIFGADGAFKGYRGVGSDITERKAGEQRLREATERAEIANRTKSEIMANMSHELRTPLNAIIGFSDTMLNGVFGALGNERYVDYVTDINESGKHLLDLINDILDVSAIEAGKMELRTEPLEVLALVRSSLKLVQHRADAAQVKLESHVEKDLPGLLADARRIKQILLNLLTNAVKFTPEGGRVSVTASRAPDGGVRFEVEDTGIGMDEAGIETALMQFGQVDSTMARKYEGTGLGLPLTKSLVELHSGTLDIRSRLGHGTTVVVHFPSERSISPDGAFDDADGVVSPLGKGRANRPGKPDTVH